MEFTVNEQGCSNLANEMFNKLNEINRIITDMESKDAVLNSALGDDGARVRRSVATMKSAMGDAMRDLKVVVNNMNEYIQKVHEIKVVLNEH